MFTARFSSLILILSALVLAPMTLARDFDLSWYTVDGGGGMFSAGGNFDVSGTIGQPDAGVMSGGDFTLAGGFWPGGQSVVPTLAGDLNCDGVVDFGDINPFVQRLTDPTGYAAAFPNCPDANGDVSGNGSVGFDDINPFVALLTGS